MHDRRAYRQCCLSHVLRDLPLPCRLSPVWWSGLAATGLFLHSHHPHHPRHRDPSHGAANGVPWVECSIREARAHRPEDLSTLDVRFSDRCDRLLDALSSVAGCCGGTEDSTRSAAGEVKHLQFFELEMFQLYDFPALTSFGRPLLVRRGILSST